MDFLNESIKQLKPSATLSVKTKAGELRAKGRSIVDFSAGEPDIDTPEHIKEAAVKALRDGKTKYTPVPGIPELRKAIAEKFVRENGIETAADRVIVSNGGKQVLHQIFQACLNPQDEVVIIAPYWVSYPVMVQMAGGVPVIVETSPRSAYKVSPEDLKAALSPRTKAVVINSPSNPTGAGYSKSELSALGKVLEASACLVISDEVYEKIIYDGFEFSSFASAAPDLADRTVTVNACSKTFSMTGWRVGYATGPADIIKGMSRIQSQTTSNVNSIAQHAAVAALSGPYDYLNPLMENFTRRLGTVMDFADKTRGVSLAARPVGSFYTFLRIDEVIEKADSPAISGSVDFANYLLEKAGVAVVPGVAFGDDGAVRVSVSSSDENIAEGLKRIDEALGTLF